MSGALGCMMAAVSPSLSRGVLPAPWSLGTSHFGAGCSVQWDEPGFAIPQGPNPPKTTTCPLTAFLPHALSLLTLLWHHTLAVLSAAAGQQASSAQRYKKLHCALKVPWGGTGVVPSKDGVFGYQLTASFSPEPGAVLPCRGLWAAAGDPPHSSLPGMGCWGYTQGVLWVLSGEGISGLWICLCACPSALVHLTVTGAAPGPLLRHQPQTHPEILQQQDPAAGGSQGGAPSPSPHPPLAHTRLPSTAHPWKHRISPQSPSPGAV